jgi:TolB protein
MFRKKNNEPGDQMPVPGELPPIPELKAEDERQAEQRPRVWLWTLLAALAVALMFVYVVALGVLGVYDGLKDRARQSLDIAQDHYELGMSYLEDNQYELAIAEFELALRHDSSMQNAQAYLKEAKELAESEITPTSETRQDAARTLYVQAVTQYEAGNLDQTLEVLDELRGLDPDFQRENVKTMLVIAHSQLGLDALRSDSLDEAAAHFEAVLELDPENGDAQEQLNLLDLYQVALNQWQQDWTATIQSLKGLYALAPEYKDVRVRLRDAYLFHAQDLADEGNWCRAYEQYAAAVEILPLESTVDKRDDAQILCQATAEAPTATPTRRPTAQATSEAQVTATPGSSPTPVTASRPAGQGQIAFTSFDALRQRTDIYVVNLGQGAARLLQESASQPAFSPNGTMLAFHNQDPEHLGLGVLDLRTNQLNELTDHVEDSAPVWSPDLVQIAFASNKHGDRKWRIYAISPYAVRGEGEEWIYGRMPNWSPDGSQLAYHGCDERGDNCGVWLMLAGGFEPARLSTDLSDTTPTWSPNGQQVAFISSRAGNWELYVVDVDSKAETRLTEHRAADVAPTWSPDGNKLAFLSNREGAWAVYVLEIASGNVQKVIATGDNYPDPVNERLSWIP